MIKSANYYSKIIIIEIAGIFTSIISIAFYFFVLGMGADLSSLSIMMVFPVGAIILGWIATSGYYWGIKKTNIPLTTDLFINFLFLSICTYYIMKYFTFKFVVRAEDLSFFDYYLYTLTESKLQGLKGPGIRVGVLVTKESFNQIPVRG